MPVVVKAKETQYKCTALCCSICLQSIPVDDNVKQTTQYNCKCQLNSSGMFNCRKQLAAAQHQTEWRECFLSQNVGAYSLTCSCSSLAMHQIYDLTLLLASTCTVVGGGSVSKFGLDKASQSACA